MNGVVVLCQRELVRFLRQPTRLVGSLAQPLLFWLFMGSGFSFSFNAFSTEITYLQYFYPGIVLMLLLFAAIFSTITLIEDRTAGFLQGVLVAPISRLSMVLGKLLGGTFIALIQACIFLFFAPFAGIELALGRAINLLFLFFLIGLGFTGLGFIIAWVVDSTAGYHAIMSVVLIPLWLLSGALFPPEDSAAWLHWVIAFNPVSYGMTAIRYAFYEPLSSLAVNPDFLFALLIALIWTTCTTVGSVLIVSRRPGG